MNTTPFQTEIQKRAVIVKYSSKIPIEYAARVTVHNTKIKVFRRVEKGNKINFKLALEEEGCMFSQKTSNLNGKNRQSTYST